MDRAALRMVCSPQFWRMAILWTLSLLHSYLLVFLRGRTAIPRRRRPRTGAGGEGRRPICVVTGVRTYSRTSLVHVFTSLYLSPWVSV